MSIYGPKINPETPGDSRALCLGFSTSLNLKYLGVVWWSQGLRIFKGFRSPLFTGQALSSESPSLLSTIL